MTKGFLEVLTKVHTTEKSHTLSNLQGNESNKSIARFKQPKKVFRVHPQANKVQIKEAVESLYKEQNVKVTKVNTLNTPRKRKKRGKGRVGKTASFKKAVVTFRENDSVE